jgi:hypothetical protein
VQQKKRDKTSTKVLGRNDTGGRYRQKQDTQKIQLALDTIQRRFGVSSGRSPQSIEA